MRIVIPTYGRVHNQKTFNLLPPLFKELVQFVVRPSEADAIAEIYPLNDILVVKKPGVPAARQAAIEVAIEEQEKKVIFLDDDLRFCIRDPNWKFKVNTAMHQMTQPQIKKSLNWMTKRLNVYASCGLDARGGNHQRPDIDHRESYRMMRAFAVRTDVLKRLGISFSKYKYWEDFHVTLCLLKQGYPNIVSMTYTVDSLTNTEGGCSTYRKIDEMYRVQRRFINEHYPFAKGVDKNIKSWVGELSKTRSTAPDLRMQWRKAIKHGEEEHGRQKV